MNIRDILVTGRTAKLPGDMKEQESKPPARRHKYGVAAREDRTAQGTTFASKREMEAFLGLQRLEKAGAIRDLQCQVPFQWEVVYRANGKEYVKKEKYIADFTYWEGDEFVTADAKGFRTSVYKHKRRIMRELFGIEIREC